MPRNTQLKLKTRIRKVFKLVTKQWQFRKKAFYTYWHTGQSAQTTPNPVQNLKLVTRIRHKFIRVVRKKLNQFKIWNTGLQFNLPVKFITRQRKVKKSSWQLRKLTKYFQWHTGLSAQAQPNPVQNLSLKTRKRKKVGRTERAKLRTYQVFHTGQFTLSPVVHFVSRSRKKLVVSERRRQARFGINYHTGLAPIVVITSTWLSPGLTSAHKHGNW